MEPAVETTKRSSRFPEPAMTMPDVDAALRQRVEASRIEAAIDQGSVPVLVVPAAITGLAGLRLAMQAAINARG